MATQTSSQAVHLDEGVYCLTRSDRGPQPSTVGVATSDVDVTIIGFNSAKTLDQGSAILIEVRKAGSITITTQTEQAPPNIGIVKLSDHREVHVADELPRPEIMIHAQNVGDIGGTIGEWIGTRGGGRSIEGFGLAPSTISDNEIEYCAMLGADWFSPWVDGGTFCGSRGMGLPLLGFAIRLKGEAIGRYWVAYSACFVDGTSLGPVADGETIFASANSPLEAIHVTLEPIS
jgi:hypothetical protein